MDYLEAFKRKIMQRHPYAMMVPQEAAMGIASEAGEYLQLVRKWEFEDKPFNEGEAIVELSDVFHYLMQACFNHDISLEELARVNLLKMEAGEKGELRTYEQAMRHLDRHNILNSELDEIEAAIAVVLR